VFAGWSQRDPLNVLRENRSRFRGVRVDDLAEIPHVANDKAAKCRVV
jgi:hypothetical protein